MTKTPKKPGNFISMLNSLRLERKNNPEFDPKKTNTVHKLDEYTKKPLRYVKRDNYKVKLTRGTNVLFKHPVTSYEITEHRDEYDARDGSNRKILVPSDETVVVIVCKYYDQGNQVGRNLRLAGKTPVNSIEDTINRSLGVILGDSDDDPPPEAA